MAPQRSHRLALSIHAPGGRPLRALDRSADISSSLYGCQV
jgi:hypothetical protein